MDVEDVHDRGNLLRQVLEHLDSLETRSAINLASALDRSHQSDAKEKALHYSNCYYLSLLKPYMRPIKAFSLFVLLINA